MLYAFGSADVASGRPVDPETIRRIASVTKTMPATGPMQQFDAGRFGLEDPVTPRHWGMRASRECHVRLRADT